MSKIIVHLEQDIFMLFQATQLFLLNITLNLRSFNLGGIPVKNDMLIPQFFAV